MEQTQKLKTSKPYSPEFRERAVRLAMEHRDKYQSEAASLTAIAGKLGCSPNSLRVWARQVQRDGGERSSQTSAEKARIKELEREVRQLRQANEILRKAAAYFAQAELDRPFRKRWISLRKAERHSGSSRSARRCSLPLPPIMTGVPL